MVSSRKLAFLSCVYLINLMLLAGCDSASTNKSTSLLNSETSPIAIIPLPTPATTPPAFEIPSVIDPKDFMSATDDNIGLWGVPHCVTVGSSLTATPSLPSCPIKWPTDGEGLDYLVTSMALVPQTYSLVMSVSSGDRDAYIAIESPPGQLIGHVSA
ncbi:MAG: hypothetical protein EOP07_26395, partial [Proteobacteria bacterium]